ncbi:DUF4870 domain-containing protein [Brachybacterium endophyticum]|uniref:DUF4870 domain-containing protein n=1 Tax=Brachybacterium endophyticum TaxID=2182385 RepID=A0A2U2RID6_9MICO|nr:DUF4870 domain-containing protein [Brachybacterium endophyticum]PWH05544.1 DUF4870 domain-containing protein [Brachybacterium endophyticum]
MSENTDPVDPYGPRPDGKDSWAQHSDGEGLSPQPGAARSPEGTSAADGSVAASGSSSAPGSGSIENEFSAPRPSGDGASSSSQQSTAQDPSAPYGQGSPADQGGYQQYGAGQDGPHQQAGGARPGGYQYPGGAQDQGSAQQPGGNQQPGGYQQQRGYQQQGGYQQAPGAAPSGDWSNTPPPHIKGVSPVAMTGQPVSEPDVKLWSILAQVASIVGNLIGLGFLGWLGPLVIFLVYKDRNRFVRYNAAEALNAAIAVVIASIVLWIVLGIFAVITLGFGSVLFPLVGIPPLLHIIFAIIGAVKANDRQWWNYPLNIRFVK